MNDADRAALAEQYADVDNHMLELRELLRAATTYEPASAEDFSLEHGGDELGRHFEDVRRYERDSGLHVPDLEPLVVRKSLGLFVARTR